MTISWLAVGRHIGSTSLPEYINRFGIDARVAGVRPLLNQLSGLREGVEKLGRRKGAEKWVQVGSGMALQHLHRRRARSDKEYGAVSCESYGLRCYVLRSRRGHEKGHSVGMRSGKKAELHGERWHFEAEHR